MPLIRREHVADVIREHQRVHCILMGKEVRSRCGPDRAAYNFDVVARHRASRYT